MGSSLPGNIFVPFCPFAPNIRAPDSHYLRVGPKTYAADTYN